eukprot:Pgem_evm1s18003
MEQSPDETVDLSEMNLKEIPKLLFDICNTGEKKNVYLNENSIRSFPEKSYFAFRRIR